MKAHLSALLLTAALGGLAGTANAALVAYTDSASFLGAIEADYYFENFQSLSGSGLPASLPFGPVNGYGYTASASTSTLYRSSFSGNYALSVNNASAVLQLAFTGNPVTALGGFFFPQNSSGGTSGRIVLSFSDGSNWQFDSASRTSFIGFTSSVAITTLSIDAPFDFCGGTICWETMDDFYVGAAKPVPVPATALLFGAGLLGLGLRRGRARRRAGAG